MGGDRPQPRCAAVGSARPRRVGCAPRGPKTMVISSGPMSRLSTHSASRRRIKWGLEDERAEDLDLSHGQVPPVASGAVGVGQRQRNRAHQRSLNTPDRPRPERVAGLVIAWNLLSAAGAITSESSRPGTTRWPFP